MNQQRLNEYTRNIRHFLSARRLHGAIDCLRQLLVELAAPYNLRQRLENIDSDYRLLAKYALDGVDDPSRSEVYRRISGGIDDILTAARRQVEMVDGSSIYYATARAFAREWPSTTIEGLVNRVKRTADDVQLSMLSGTDGPHNPRRGDLYRDRRGLFDAVWTTFPLSVDDASALDAFLTDDAADSDSRAIVVSALLMALLYAYDERALYLLLHCYYTSEVEDVKLRALCALLIAMSINRHRVPGPGSRFGALLATVSDCDRWGEDVRMAFLQFIRTRDTEKITRRMRDEIIPEMLKLRPDLYDKMRSMSEDALSEEGIDGENPEWEELLESSGLGEKMRQMQEMQEDGADVMMSTFAQLKTYPFFRDAAHWFYPFDPLNPAIPAADSALVGMLTDMPMLCDSDKYSVAFSLAQVPRAQRDMLQAQFDAQQSQLAELRSTSLSGDAEARQAIVTAYVQDLYRFFKLFRRKGDLNDPFATALNLATVGALSSALDDAEHLSMIAGFYFKRGYYADALALYKRLPGKPDAALLQQMGYCLQQTGDIEGALGYYLKAEMLDPRNAWTLRRVASCYRLLGRPAEALPRYETLAELRPDDLGVTLHTGHCLMEIGRYKDALKHYFKVEYLDSRSTRALRPIAWCSFLAGDYDRARQYYERIPKDTLTATDYLNMGHLAMVTHRYREAVDLYRRSLEASDGDRSKFNSMMQTDLHHLRDAGVDDLLTGLVLDEM